MPYTYTVTSVIPATAEEIYEAWLDSLSHTEMTGGEAAMSDEVGAEVSAWDGYISGRNLELVPGERIVQSWRTSKFDDGHEDSIVTITFADAGDGTLLTLVHSNVPDDQRSYEEGGWESNYFEPMRVYFSKLAQEAGAEQAEAAPSETPTAKPRRAAGKKLKAAKARATRKRLAKAKSAKKAAASPTPSPARKKKKRAAAPKAKGRRPTRPAAKRKRGRSAARKSQR